jgi:carbon monoxide dehydrogenase subunit G
MDIDLSTRVARPPDAVWQSLADISSHTRWMKDAVEIRFTSPAVAGIGATFECDTRVGPLRTTDRMEVVEWNEGRTIAIRHGGLVSGTGRFTIEPDGTSQTIIHWSESLKLPWRLGGPVGARFAKPLLRHVWQGNLARLRNLLEVSES